MTSNEIKAAMEKLRLLGQLLADSADNMLFGLNHPENADFLEDELAYTPEAFAGAELVLTNLLDQFFKEEY